MNYLLHCLNCGASLCKRCRFCPKCGEKVPLEKE